MIKQVWLIEVLLRLRVAKAMFREAVEVDGYYLWSRNRSWTKRSNGEHYGDWFSWFLSQRPPLANSAFLTMARDEYRMCICSQFLYFVAWFLFISSLKFKILLRSFKWQTIDFHKADLSILNASTAKSSSTAQLSNLPYFHKWRIRINEFALWTKCNYRLKLSRRFAPDSKVILRIWEVRLSRIDFPNSAEIWVLTAQSSPKANSNPKQWPSPPSRST